MMASVIHRRAGLPPTSGASGGRAVDRSGGAHSAFGFLVLCLIFLSCWKSSGLPGSGLASSGAHPVEDQRDVPAAEAGGLQGTGEGGRVREHPRRATRRRPEPMSRRIAAPRPAARVTSSSIASRSESRTDCAGGGNVDFGRHVLGEREGARA